MILQVGKPFGSSKLMEWFNYMENITTQFCGNELIHHEITIPTDLINKMEKRGERGAVYTYICFIHHEYVHKYTT